MEEKNDLEKFLHSRGICEATIKYFRDEHIDETALLLLEPSRLEELIPKCGDRLAALDYCRNRTNPQKYSLIERLRIKLNKNKHPTEEKEHLKKKFKGSSKDTRMIEIGWLIDINNDGTYTQVRTKQGGGSRKMSIPKEFKKSDILEKAVALFFPNGTSVKGAITEFETNLLDFKQNEIDDDISVNDLFITTGLSKLRFYLATKKNKDSESQSTSSGSRKKYTRYKLKKYKKPVKYILSESESGGDAGDSNDSLKSNETASSLFQNFPSFDLTSNLTEHENTNLSQICTVSGIQDEVYNIHTDTKVAEFTHDEVNNVVTETELVHFYNDEVNINIETNDTEVLRFDDDEDITKLDVDTECELNKKQNENNAVTLKDILMILASNIVEDKINYFNIYRDDIFQCMLRGLRRKSFSENNKISVLFTDLDNISEGAVDSGGPTREMFNLALKYLKNSHLFEGDDYNRKYITRNHEAFQNHEYYEAGRIIALSIVHCGIGPGFFSKFLYKMITSGVGSVEPTLEDVINHDIRNEIELATNALDLPTLRTVLVESNYLGIAGWETIKDFKNKDAMLKDVLRFYSIEINVDCFNQFTDGLKTLNVLNYLQSFPEQCENLMCNTTQLTYENFTNMFSVNYSVIGSNRRSVESRILTFWQDFLLDCCENSETKDECSLNEIIQFWSGTDIIPILGFEPQLSIEFLHEDRSKYPKSNTCALKLSLPTVHLRYEDFKKDMNFGIKNGMVFGFV